ncbi:MAG: hypothetical protein QOH26_1329 [Actinomycetota bacterium]|nr:hypothetical protein [Actinomycetota bacterium]
MDEQAVRQHAEGHGQAVVAGDLRTASQDLAETGREAAGTVMPQLPRPVTGAEVLSIEVAGDEHVVLIRYSGEDKQATVESRWADQDGRPMIVDMKVV